MALENLTKQASGVVPISQAIGVDAAVIQDPGPGRWKIWGHCRHTLADGLRLMIQATQIAIIAGAANTTIRFGPFVVDITNATDDIIVELNVATGGSDTASATVYAQKIG